MDSLIIGVDGGGTKTTVMVADARGHVLGRGTGGPSNYQAVGKEKAIESILAAIVSAFTEAGIERQHARTICLGMAGFGRSEDQVWLAEWCRLNNVAEKIEILTDAELLLWAGTPEGWGIGCISGTGSITFGIDKKGNTARAGGWGYILGDEGSGYAIGLAALRAVTQATDGRAQHTALTGRILDAWNLEDPSGLIQLVYRSGMPREQISALTSIVVEEAAEGDMVASAILEGAAQDLSVALNAVASKLGFTHHIPCAFGGGVLTHCPKLVQTVVRKATQAGVKIDPVKVVEEPVIGAVKFAIQHPS